MGILFHIKKIWDEGNPLFQAFVTGLVILFCLAIVLEVMVFPRWTHLSCEGDCVPLAIGEMVYEDGGGIGISVLGAGEFRDCGKENFYFVPIRIENSGENEKQAAFWEFRLVDSNGNDYPADYYVEDCNNDDVLETLWVDGGHSVETYLWFALGEGGSMPSGETTIVWEPNPPESEPAFFAFNST